MTAYAGQIASPADYITDTRKLIGRGSRTTSSSTTTTETSVLRIDGVSLKANRHYRITSSVLFTSSSVNNDVVTVRLRSTTDGTTATTSSTQIGQNNAIWNFAAGPGETVCADVNPGSDVTMSLLLTVGRTAGTGNVSILGASTFPISVWIDDMGPDTGNIGIAL